MSHERRDQKLPTSTRPEGATLNMPRLVPLASVTTPAPNQGAEVIIATIGLLLSGASELGGLLRVLLDTLSAVQRAIAIGINNYLEQDLQNPSFYIFSGKIDYAALIVEAKHCGGAGAGKTAGPVATGAVGLLAYEIAGIDHRFVIMYSVPFDYGLYKNWFKLSIVPNSVPIDQALYEDMYYDYGKLTQGKAAPADAGTAIWAIQVGEQEYVLQGVMGTGGLCTLNVAIETAQRA